MNSIESNVSIWSGIEVEPHRFNAQEFTLDGREIGHIHGSHLVNIPFTKRIRDILVEEKRAQKHHVLPESGWVSYRIRSDEDIEEALWLLRVSYLYHLRTMRKRGEEHPASDAIDIDAALSELDVSDELDDVYSARTVT